MHVPRDELGNEAVQMLQQRLIRPDAPVGFLASRRYGGGGGDRATALEQEKSDVELDRRRLTRTTWMSTEVISKQLTAGFTALLVAGRMQWLAPLFASWCWAWLVCGWSSAVEVGRVTCQLLETWTMTHAAKQSLTHFECSYPLN